MQGGILCVMIFNVFVFLSRKYFKYGGLEKPCQVLAKDIHAKLQFVRNTSK